MLTLNVLGGLSLEVGGGAGRGAASQRGRLAILAVIAASGRLGVSRDRLQLLFWPESNAERARNALNQALHALRRDTGERELVSAGPQLRLNRDVVLCDLAVFDEALANGELERAVEAYRGPFLDGVHVNAAADLERWMSDERDSIGARYRAALRQLADRASAEHRPVDAVRWWERLAADDRLSAAVAVGVMKAHLANGDSAGALRHARNYGTLIGAELETGPDPAVTALVASITRDLDAARAATGAAIAPRSLVSQGTSATPDLPVEAASSRQRHRRAWSGFLAVPAVLVTVALGMAVRDDPPPSSRRVVVAALRQGPDDQRGHAAAELLRSQIAEGVAQLEPLEVVEAPASAARLVQGSDAASARALAQGVHARFVVFTSVDENAGQAVLRVTIFDAVRRLDIATQASPPTSDSAVRVLRSRTMATLAAHTDPLLSSWAHAAALPRNWESMTAFRTGIEQWRLGRRKAARGHFRLSASLDSTAGTPLVWLAYVSDADSAAVLEDVVLAARRVGPWDRAMLGYLRATRAGDPQAIHARAHEVLDAAPGSDFALLVASSAATVGHASEALELLQQVNPDSGLFGASAEHWRVLTGANHFLGRYDAELAGARAALRRDPADRIYMQAEARALSGLGRGREVERVCERSQNFRARPGWNYQPCGQAVLELAAHGRREDARRLAVRLGSVGGVALDADDAGMQLSMAEWMVAIGDLAAARQALAQTSPLCASDSAEWRFLAVLVDAAAGRRDRVEAYVKATDSLPDPRQPPGEASVARAQLLAMLGARDEAVAWLSRSLREGFRFRGALHVLPGLDRLRGYAPYESLMAPVADPEQAWARPVSSPGGWR